MRCENFIVKTIKKEAFYLFLALVSLAVTIFNLYLSSKLSPLANRIDSLQDKVYANSKEIEKNTELRQDIPVMKNDIANIKDNMREIKQYLYYKLGR